MLNLPVNPNAIYSHSDKKEKTTFEDTERTEAVTINSKEYSETILAAVQSRVAGMTAHDYQGEQERIAREVYHVKIYDTTYIVRFIFDRRENENIQLQIEIELADQGTRDFEQTYNKPLESLKIELKDQLKKDWKLCTWLVDDQSEMLCVELYHQVFKIENQMRAFVNKVLIQQLGHDWLKKPGLEKYYTSVSNMETSFKQTVPQFASINSTLLSMTLETLSEIIKKGVIYEENTILSADDVHKIFDFLKNGNEDAAKQAIQKKRSICIKIWDDVFKQYFIHPDQFQSQLTQFIKSRNHIAHNKLLTLAAYHKINNAFTEFKATIENASELYDNQNPSVEMLDTWQAELDQEEYAEYYEEESLRDRIAEEAGIELRDKEQIYELFYDTIRDIYNEIFDKFYYDDGFEISDIEDPADDGTTTVCVITSKVSEDELKISTTISIDDDMGADSFLEIVAEHNGEQVAIGACDYHNGDGYESDCGICEPYSASIYDDSQRENFKDEVILYIEEDLNPYVRIMQSMQYESAQHGGSNPVAEFPCEECGKCGVSILEEFLPIGTCCYCGYENEVHICERCGCVYDDIGGNEYLCNGCIPREDD